MLRVTIVFGGLPNSTTKTVAHHLQVDESFRIINLYLAASDTVDNKYFCLQYFSIAPGDIVISMDATNIIVTTQSDYTDYNVSYVIVEFCTGVI